MGGIVSVDKDIEASWTPTTKFKEILTEAELADILTEEPNPGEGGPTVEQLLDMTAAELFMTMIGTMGTAMAVSMDMSEKQALRMNDKWLPYLSVANCTAVPAVGKMWAKVNWTTNEIRFDVENVAIAAGEIGRFPLPKTFDIRRDYPHNHLLQSRTIELNFEDGRAITIDCNRMNQGRSKTSVSILDHEGKLVIQDSPEFQVIEEKDKKDEKDLEVGMGRSMKMMKFVSYGATLCGEGEGEMNVEKVDAFIDPIAKAMTAERDAERASEAAERASAAVHSAE